MVIVYINQGQKRDSWGQRITIFKWSQMGNVVEAPMNIDKILYLACLVNDPLWQLSSCMEIQKSLVFKSKYSSNVNSIICVKMSPHTETKSLSLFSLAQMVQLISRSDHERKMFQLNCGPRILVYSSSHYQTSPDVVDSEK